MPLIQLKNVSLSFGDQPLLDQVSLTIEDKERIALVGRNGTGKSTLLKLLEKAIFPDDGELVFQDGLIVKKLIQEIPNHLQGDVRSIIALGNTQNGTILTQYYQSLANDDELPASVQEKMNEGDAWQLDQRIKMLCSKINLDPEKSFSTLSGGQKRRVLLAQSLLDEPDLLMLDEPTNHLDIPTIEWLEQMLLNLHCALLIVSHDRTFINQLSTRIIDLDRGVMSSWPGNFEQYLISKEKAIEDETNQQKAFDKRLAQEEVWIRKGIQARRTRNEGRVRSLKQMRDQRSKRITVEKSANFKLNEASSSGKLVVETQDVSYAHDNEENIINNLNTTILRGEKIGIIGPNGCGKSTLIKLLTGEITASAGKIKHGTRLEIAYLDQHRSAIRDDMTLLDNIAQGRSEVEVNGKSMHVMTYVQDFLFSPERARVPADALSGGERNRLMLAKLFTKPFNLLILDEPTNDLDIDTLELLEQKLVDYEGTLLLVSHDRTFLNNIVTSTLVFEGNGQVNEYVGGYDDWLRQRKPSEKQSQKTSSSKQKTKQKPKKKLSYKDQNELDALPLKIEQTEIEIEKLNIIISDPNFYQQDNSMVLETNQQLQTLEKKLAKFYTDWERLELK